MNTGAVLAIRVAAAIALVVFFLVVIRPKKLASVRMLAPLAEGTGAFHWTLRIVLAVAAAHFAAATFMLIATSAGAFFYAIALIHGELFTQLPHLPRTAGAVCVHIVFPLQVFLAGVIALLIAAAGWRELIGPLPGKVGIRLGENLFARAAMTLGIIACLEVVRILFVGLLTPGHKAAEFFAINTPPKMDILPVSLLAAGVGVGAALLILWLKRSGGES